MDNWARTLKLVYRKEPIVSFMVTAGLVNVAIGGLSEHWSLMSVGLSVVGIAIAVGVRQMQSRRRPLAPRHRPAAYVLPPARATSLPMLDIAKKNPPER